MQTAQTTTPAPAMERRRSEPATGTRAVATIVVGALLFLPGLAWGGALVLSVATTDANSRLLYLLGLPLFMCACGALLFHQGFNHLRGVVPSLDRRQGA